jgi:hypothetical protein
MGTSVKLSLYGGGLFFSVLAPAALYACAVCVGSSGNDPVNDAFNWSVLFMMATPYAIFGTIGGWIYYQQRRTGTAQTDSASKEKPYLNWNWTQRENER